MLGNVVLALQLSLLATATVPPEFPTSYPYRYHLIRLLLLFTISCGPKLLLLALSHPLAPSSDSFQIFKEDPGCTAPATTPVLPQGILEPVI